MIIWMWAFLLAAPWAIFFEIKNVDDIDYCLEIWPEGFQWESYYFLLANLFLCYLFPLSVISLCYLVIWLRVYRRPLPCDSLLIGQPVESNQNSSNLMNIHRKAKVSVLKMVISVVFMFALSWLPLYVIFGRIKLGNLSSIESDIIDFATPLAQWLGNSNSMWNPFIYCFLSVKFRRSFNFLFCGANSRCRREPTPHYQKPNVNILLKRLNAYKATNSCSYNVTEV